LILFNWLKLIRDMGAVGAAARRFGMDSFIDIENRGRRVVERSRSVLPTRRLSIARPWSD